MVKSTFFKISKKIHCTPETNMTLHDHYIGTKEKISRASDSLSKFLSFFMFVYSCCSIFFYAQADALFAQYRFFIYHLSVFTDEILYALEVHPPSSLFLICMAILWNHMLNSIFYTLFVNNSICDHVARLAELFWTSGKQGLQGV